MAACLTFGGSLKKMLWWGNWGWEGSWFTASWVVQKPPKQVLLSPESLSMAGLWIQFGPSDVCLGVAERTLEGGEANGGLRDKPFQKAQKAGKLKQADRDSRRYETLGRIRAEGWEGRKSHLVYLLPYFLWWWWFFFFMKKLRASKVKWQLKSWKISEACGRIRLLKSSLSSFHCVVLTEQILSQASVSTQRFFVHSPHLA